MLTGHTRSLKYWPAGKTDTAVAHSRSQKKGLRLDLLDHGFDDVVFSLSGDDAPARKNFPYKVSTSLDQVNKRRSFSAFPHNGSGA